MDHPTPQTAGRTQATALPLTVLILEDEQPDFELERRALTRAGIACSAHRVDDPVAFVRALHTLNPDIVIVDYNLPGFDGLEAARIAKHYRADLPVLLVTGALNDDTAVNAYNSGISDYVLKDRLARLPAAVGHALSEAQWFRQRQRIEADRDVLIRIMECTETGVIGTDLNGTVTAWNRSATRFYGCGRDDAIGRPVRTVLGSIYLDTLDRAVQRAGRAGAIESLEQEIAADTGERRTLSLSISPIHDSAEGITGVSILVRDVTEQKRTQLQLQQARDQATQANEAKSRFLALITHELRTPLHGILGYGELMLLEGGLTPEQSQHLESMMAAGQYLLATINAVLDMSQIEAERMELVPSAIDLADLVRTCLDVVRPVANAKGLALLAAPGEPLLLAADPTRLRQVLLNLLGNAIKFTPAGRVELRFQGLPGDRVRLEVRDTGPGVRPMHRDKLFQMFERLNAAAVSGIEGTGLGLALTARLVRLMGGHIGYDDNPGGGSVFWVELPRGDVTAAADETARTLPPVAGSARLHVLAADDDALNRKIASRFLTMAGHAVTCVESGAAAVEQAAGRLFDVILMDVRMPGMNGLEATQRIRALPPPHCDVAVVAVTAHAFLEQVRSCRVAGMDGHVAKPFKQATLLAAVTQAAECRHNRQNAAETTDSATDSLPATELPLFDQAVFAEIEHILPRAELAASLRTLIARAEALRSSLVGPAPRPGDEALAAAAHKLAGGAGTLGFSAIAGIARAFEQAADSAAPETHAVARQLAELITASLSVARDQLHAIDAKAAAARSS